MREPGKPKVSKNGEPNGERERIVNLFIDYHPTKYGLKGFDGKEKNFSRKAKTTRTFGIFCFRSGYTLVEDDSS